MDNKKVLKNIIESKRKNTYTENKTVDQLRKETEIAGSLIPLPKNIKYKRVVVGKVEAEWITCGEVNEDKITLHGNSSITLNGIAQGWITDKITDLLSNYGLNNTLVDFGENYALGLYEKSRPWNILIKTKIVK